MNIKSIFVNLGKLVFCVFAYVVGLGLGGMLVTSLKLQPPPMPEGFDASTAGLYMIVESPFLALVLVGLSRSIAGSFWVRTFMLASVTWVSNTLNNQIEASFFGNMASGFLFTIITFLIPSILVAATVALVFPPISRKTNLASAAKSFFGRYPASGWIWRLGVGAILFMPIYYFFGLLVIPFTSEYYRQGLFGLQVPSLDQLLVILFIRSVLFFLACCPILIAWQSSERKLVLYMGLALFYFVGLQALVLANWMPWALRLPHLVEILADEFVYAFALVKFLGIEKQKPVRVEQLASSA